MRPYNQNREFVFAIKDISRLIGTYADQQASRVGMTRAQWAVLSRIERHEGLKQSEIAEMLDLQPISLTRLLDRLADNGLIERRPDPNDRRANRLYLKAAAKPLLDKLDGLGRELTQNLLAGISPETVEQMLKDLGAARENARRAIAANSNEQQAANG